MILTINLFVGYAQLSCLMRVNLVFQELVLAKKIT